MIHPATKMSEQLNRKCPLGTDFTTSNRTITESNQILHLSILEQ